MSWKECLHGGFAHANQKEASVEYLKDILEGIKYDVDKIIEKTEGLKPDEYNYAFLQEFLASMTTGSIQARRIVEHFRMEVRNGEV